MSNDRILVGKFGAPHGVRGEIRLKSYTADPMAIKTYKSLQLRDGTDMNILSARQKGEMLVIRLETSQSREDAAALNLQDLFVDRDELPKITDEDEFYLADLVGLEAIGRDGEKLGQVIDVPDFGSGELLEIAPMDGDRLLRGKSWFVEFTKINVPEIDIAAKKLVVVPPLEVSERDEDPRSSDGKASSP